MSQLKQLRQLIRRPVSWSKIVRLTNRHFGESTYETKMILKAAAITRDINRGKKRKNGEARISHERDMYVILIHKGIIDYVLAVSIFLHDLYEENPKKWPLYRIEEVFGPEVRKVVSAVSKPRMSDTDLVSAKGSIRIAKKVRRGGWRAMVLKADDRTHFFMKPYPGQKEDRRRLVWKVVQTMQYIQQMALEVRFLAAELEVLVGDCIRKNNITTEELAEFV